MITLQLAGTSAMTAAEGRSSSSPCSLDFTMQSRPLIHTSTFTNLPLLVFIVLVC